MAYRTKTPALTPFDLMVISAGGKTQKEMEDAELRAAASGTARNLCRLMARRLTIAARWFEARSGIARQR